MNQIIRKSTLSRHDYCCLKFHRVTAFDRNGKRTHHHHAAKRRTPPGNSSFFYGGGIDGSRTSKCFYGGGRYSNNFVAVELNSFPLSSSPFTTVTNPIAKIKGGGGKGKSSGDSGDNDDGSKTTTWKPLIDAALRAGELTAAARRDMNNEQKSSSSLNADHGAAAAVSCSGNDNNNNATNSDNGGNSAALYPPAAGVGGECIEAANVLLELTSKPNFVRALRDWKSANHSDGGVSGNNNFKSIDSNNVHMSKSEISRLHKSFLTIISWNLWHHTRQMNVAAAIAAVEKKKLQTSRTGTNVLKRAALDDSETKYISSVTIKRKDDETPTNCVSGKKNTGTALKRAIGLALRSEKIGTPPHKQLYLDLIAAASGFGGENAIAILSLINSLRCAIFPTRVAEEIFRVPLLNFVQQGRYADAVLVIERMRDGYDLKELSPKLSMDILRAMAFQTRTYKTDGLISIPDAIGILDDDENNNIIDGNTENSELQRKAALKLGAFLQQPLVKYRKMKEHEYRELDKLVDFAILKWLQNVTGLSAPQVVLLMEMMKDIDSKSQTDEDKEQQQDQHMRRNEEENDEQKEELKKEPVDEESKQQEQLQNGSEISGNLSAEVSSLSRTKKDSKNSDSPEEAEKEAVESIHNDDDDDKIHESSALPQSTSSSLYSNTSFKSMVKHEERCDDFIYIRDDSWIIPDVTDQLSNKLRFTQKYEELLLREQEHLTDMDDDDDDEYSTDVSALFFDDDSDDDSDDDDDDDDDALRLTVKISASL